MQRLGFIHDMLDVKVLVLFVMARSNYALTAQEIYDLCYQDDCVSYFDICTALPEMVKSGHMEVVEEDKYQITPKGRETEELTGDSIAFTVKQKAENAVARSNRQIRRLSYIKTQIVPKESGEFSVTMSLDDDMGNLMKLELQAPDSRQAHRLTALLEERAENVYNLIMSELLYEDE